jgi:hypothetical protein
MLETTTTLVPMSTAAADPGHVGHPADRDSLATRVDLTSADLANAPVWTVPDDSEGLFDDDDELSMFLAAIAE